MNIYCEYTPRGKHGGALCTPLKFVGECLGHSIKDGYYNIWDGSCTYSIPISEMNEAENEKLNTSK